MVLPSRRKHLGPNLDSIMMTLATVHCVHSARLNKDRDTLYRYSLDGQQKSFLIQSSLYSLRGDYDYH